MDASDVAARTRTVAQLAEIVQAMRTLASAQRRQAQDRFSGLARYAAATCSALGEALALLDADADEVQPVGARRVVALLSEHGFVGGLDDTLLARAATLGRSVGADLVVVGSRGRRLCRESGVVASDGGPMPTTIAAVQSTAERLIEELFDDVAEGRVAEVYVVFCRASVGRELGAPGAATVSPGRSRLAPPAGEHETPSHARTGRPRCPRHRGIRLRAGELGRRGGLCVGADRALSLDGRGPAPYRGQARRAARPRARASPGGHHERDPRDRVGRRVVRGSAMRSWERYFA